MPEELKYFGESLPYLKPFQKKGKLIAVEGTDGCGRSTQLSLLRNWLEVQGYAVVETGWARSNLMHKSIELAKSGNTMDRMTFTLLYATDFADRFENLIIPALKSGHIVLTDRYIFTAMARDVVDASFANDMLPAWLARRVGAQPTPEELADLVTDFLVAAFEAPA